jgi:hypothetical protein
MGAHQNLMMQSKNRIQTTKHELVKSCDALKRQILAPPCSFSVSWVDALSWSQHLQLWIGPRIKWNVPEGAFYVFSFWSDLGHDIFHNFIGMLPRFRKAWSNLCCHWAVELHGFSTASSESIHAPDWALKVVQVRPQRPGHNKCFFSLWDGRFLGSGFRWG